MVNRNSDGSYFIEADDGLPLDLEHTLFCGQCFSWKRESASAYSGALGGEAIRLVQEDTAVTAYCSPASVDALVHYLAADLSYAQIRRSFPRDPFLDAALRAAPGLRVLRQPHEETIISFIVSANNNIKRITMNLDALSHACGKPLGNGAHAFAEPAAIAALGAERLRELGLGYRAPYLAATCAALAEHGIESDALRALDIEAANRTLCQYAGIGPKVADCILLFGFQRYDAFPIDVWTARLLEMVYRIRERNLIATARAAREHFGPYAGIAQQYLFYYSRAIGAQGLEQWQRRLA